MRGWTKGILMFALALAGSPALAQVAAVDHLTQRQLLDRAKLLETQASTSDGSASVRLAEYPNHFTMVSLRQRSGSAEVHQKYADIFLVLQGRATLTTGGSVVDPKETGSGEVRGRSVAGGTNTILNEGDLVHIPAGTPHQLLLENGNEFVYFVVKVQEK